VAGLRRRVVAAGPVIGGMGLSDRRGAHGSRDTDEDVLQLLPDSEAVSRPRASVSHTRTVHRAWVACRAVESPEADQRDERHVGDFGLRLRTYAHGQFGEQTCPV